MRYLLFCFALVAQCGFAQATAPFVEASGRVVVEAESFSRSVARDGHEFVAASNLGGYSGASAMRALPEDTRAWTLNYTREAAELRYDVLFSRSGRYQFWVRAYGASGTSDSLHAGVNGTPVGTRQTDPDNRYVWLLMGAVDIGSGLQQLNLWVRESGITVDKIVLTQDTGFTPSGSGPVQSSRDGGGDGNTAPTVTVTGPAAESSFSPAQTVVLSGSAVDAEDGDLSSSLTWASSIDGDLGAGAQLSNTLSAGTHTLTASVTDGGGLSASDSVTITVADVIDDPVDSGNTGGGNGSGDSEAGTGAFVEASGRVVVEAESFSRSVARDGHEFVAASNLGGYSGASAMRALPEDTRAWTLNYTREAAELRYDVLFSRSGRYQFWVRAYGASGTSDSLHAGVNGTPVGTRQTDPDNRYVWLLMGAVDIGSGLQELNLWVRESGITVDKIVLTQDTGFTPSGSGPVQSSRDGGGDGNTAPTVTVTGPAAESSFSPAQTVVLSGSAVDAEDGDLSSSLTWASSIDGDLGAGAQLSNTLSAGTHTLTASVTDGGGLSASDSVTITVADVIDDPVDSGNTGGGNGSGDSEAGTGAFVEASGRVVVEAESFSRSVARDGHEFVAASNLGGYSGASAMRALPEDTRAWTLNYTREAAELRYDVLFSRSGRYQFWVRAYGASGTSDSLHAGVNGTPVGTRQTDPDNRYVWLLMGSVDIGSGLQELNLWVRESGITVDKIVLTQDTGFTPSGSGPVQSSRDGGGDGAGGTNDSGGSANGSARLSWTPPGQNEDGSTLTDLAGFKVYWGTNVGNYPNSVRVNDPDATAYVVQGLASGTYRFVVTALDAAGNESRFSNVATKTVP